MMFKDAPSPLPSSQPGSFAEKSCMCILKTASRIHWSTVESYKQDEVLPNWDLPSDLKILWGWRISHLLWCSRPWCCYVRAARPSRVVCILPKQTKWRSPGYVYHFWCRRALHHLYPTRLSPGMRSLLGGWDLSSDNEVQRRHRDSSGAPSPSRLFAIFQKVLN